MKIPNILSFAALTVLLVTPLSAQEAAPAAAEPAKTEAVAPVAPEAAVVETTATEAASATAVPVQPHRPLPKVRQWTPYTGSRGHMITYSILFFVLSVIMACVLLRSKEDVPS